MSLGIRAVGLPGAVEPTYPRVALVNCESRGVYRVNCTPASRLSGSAPVFPVSIEVVRCWREARDEGVPVQPHLFAMLSDKDCGILAPVFDSLLHFFERTLRRPLRTGLDQNLSDDEALLLGRLDEAEHKFVGCWQADGTERIFGVALISTRIMLDKVLGLPATS